MQMSKNEIASSYRRADNKKLQVEILAQLNGCGEDEIRKILTETGMIPEEKPEEEEQKEPAEGPKKRGRKPGSKKKPEEAKTEPAVQEMAEPDEVPEKEEPLLRKYRSAKELLKEPGDMTDAEKDRLERIKGIPDPVRECVQREIDRLTLSIISIEQKRDEMIDFLNGERKSS